MTKIPSIDAAIYALAEQAGEVDVDDFANRLPLRCLIGWARYWQWKNAKPVTGFTDATTARLALHNMAGFKVAQ